MLLWIISLEKSLKKTLSLISRERTLKNEQHLNNVFVLEKKTKKELLQS